MGKAIAYLRVSTQQQHRSGLGIEAQRTAVGRFAEVEGIAIISEFVEAETGKGADALDRRTYDLADAQCAVKPPSTGRPTPITKLAAGLHSHSTAAATSSARPRRPIDCCFMISAIASA